MSQRAIGLSFSALLSIALVTGAARAEPGEVAVFTASGTFLEWAPLIEVESMVLALADPTGEVRTVSFGPDEMPALSLEDTNGHPLPDGSYLWELKLRRPRSASLEHAIAEAERQQDHQHVARLRRLDEPLVQVGHFVLQGGRVLVADASQTELADTAGEPDGSGRIPTVAAGQVVTDDLVIDGRACIGLGCSNGEGFFSEALRLKQAVVRVRFVDTSGQDFASRDWQLVVNAAGSGGAERFSLEDIDEGTTPFTIHGKAPTDSLTVLGVSGNVGLGAALPAKDLHLASASTPTIRLEQMGAPARTWDLGASDASFFLRDVTNGNALPFQVDAGAPSNSLRVSATGNVGLGTVPTARLHLVNGIVKLGAHSFGERTTDNRDLQFNADRNIIYNVDSNSNDPIASFSVSRNGDPNSVVFVARKDFLNGFNRQTPAFPLHVGSDATNGNGAHVTAVGIWTDGSSRVNKDRIRPLATVDALAALDGLEPVRYVGRNSPDDEEYLGFIAEDVPDLVAMNDRTGLSPMDIVAVLTRVVQEQQLKIEAQAKAHEEQRQMIDELSERVAGLSGPREAQRP